MSTQKFFNLNPLWVILVGLTLFFAVEIIPPALLGTTSTSSLALRLGLNTLLWLVIVPLALHLMDKKDPARGGPAVAGVTTHTPFWKAFLLGLLVYLVYAACWSVITAATGGYPLRLLNLAGLLNANTWLEMFDSGIFEEVAVRGVILALLIRYRKPWEALLLSAIFFGLGHFARLGLGIPLEEVLVAAATGFLSSLTFGLLYVRTRSLVPGILAHVLINILNVMVYMRGNEQNTALTLAGWVLTLLGALLLCKFAVTPLDRNLMKPLPLTAERNYAK